VFALNVRQSNELNWNIATLMFNSASVCAHCRTALMIGTFHKDGPMNDTLSSENYLKSELTYLLA